MLAIVERSILATTASIAALLLLLPAPSAQAQEEPAIPQDQAPPDIVVEDAAEIALPMNGTDRPMDIESILEVVKTHPELAHDFMSLLLPQGSDRPAEWSCIGCHESQIERQAWMESLHQNKGVTCLHCHPEAATIPHVDEISAVHCDSCHESSDAIVEDAETSAHGPQGPGAENGCGGCHDPHQMGSEGADAAAMTEAGCLECHGGEEGLTDKHSSFLCAADLHLAKVGCQHCHIEGNDSEAVHNVRHGEAANLACTECHGADSRLAMADALEDGDEAEGVVLLQAANNELIRETGYLIGANRILGLDILIILLVLGAMCFPVFHGGLRVLFGRAR